VRADPGATIPAPPLPPVASDVKTPPEPASPTPVRLVPRVETPELTWDPRWRRVSAGEMVGAGLFAAAALPFAIIPPLGSSYNTRSGFDESARNALRLGTPDALLHFHAAVVFDAAGQADRARDEIGTVLAGNPWFSARYHDQALALAQKLGVTR